MASSKESNKEIEEKTSSELIEAVRAQPCLFDKQNKKYRDKPYRQRLWDEIANAVGLKGVVNNDFILSSFVVKIINILLRYRWKRSTKQVDLSPGYVCS